MSAAALDYETTGHETTRREINAPRVETYGYMTTTTDAAVPYPAVLPLFTFSVGGHVHRLRLPLLVRVMIDEGQFFVENETLRLFGNGATLADAVQAFSADLAYCWHRYRSLNESEVAGRGVELRQLYAGLVAD